MIDLIFFLLLSALAIFLLAFPFLRRRAAAQRETFDLAFHHDQLDELERDEERGLIDAEAARAARLEIERRILTLAGEVSPSNARTQSHPSAGGGWVAAGLILVVPMTAGLLYVQLGKPELRDLPLAARPAPEQQLTERDSLLANIEQLEQHLETTTDNAAVWAALGRARLRAGLYQDAVEALAKSVDLSHDDPSLRSELGEAMVHAAGLQVTPAATEHFRAALEATPNEPRARFYLGMALAQEGEVDAAIDGWSQLLAVSPSDAPWRAQIIEAIRGALQSEGRPADDVIATLPEGTAPASSSDDNPTSTAAQDDQIRGMVEGLAARLENEPDNIEGWLMLGRSRLVLKEPDLAKKAFERARELAPNNPDVLLGYAASLLEPGETPGGDPVVVEEAVAIYEKLLTIAPDDPEPRWLLGLAAAQAGDKDRAIAHWRDLLGLIEDGAEDKAVVEARINALEDGEPAASIAAGTPSIAPMAASAAASTNGSAAGGDRVPNNARPGTGPGPEDVAAMAEMTPEERQTQIRGMVDGLAARLEDDPSDIEGWLRLAQSRTVLGEPDAAAEAYRRAMAQAPDDPDVLRAYAGSLLGAPHPETEAATVGADAADLYRKIIAIEPDDPEAHWYLGLAAIQDGTIDDAKTHWRRVLDLLGPDHPNYAAVQSRLDRVETEIR